jgi:hypothetical protein
MKASFVPPALLLIAVSLLPALATQEPPPAVEVPFRPTPDFPNLDAAPAPSPAAADAVPGSQPVSGPIAPAGGQPAGALSGRIVFTSAGHGWDWTGSAWALGRPLLLEMNEDYGNLDQMTMFAIYCFNAGATVVPFRPIGFQTNEVVLDNVSAGVTWSGSWSDSSSTVYYGQAAPCPTGSPTCPRLKPPPPPTLRTYGGRLLPVSHVGAGRRAIASTALPHSTTPGDSPSCGCRLNGGQRVGLPRHLLFQRGSNPAKGAVIISNLGEGASPSGVVIADAIPLWQRGMGNVDRGGASPGYPARRMLPATGFKRVLSARGQDSGIYANGNVTAPPRMAVEDETPGR